MNRERLTITLKKDVLKLLDSFVDGEKIRNRSHAVEFLLAKSLAKEAMRALILAGGKGVKTQNARREIPKAMLPVGGEPLLSHTIKKLKASGFRDIVISLGDQGEVIQEYFGSGEKWEVKISYLRQNHGRPGTAQPVKQAEKQFSSPFVLVYGDVLSDLNFNDMVSFHKEQKNIVGTMALVSVERVVNWGVARLAGTKIMEFQEKPERPFTHSHLVNAGMCVLEPSIFKYIKQEDVRLESTVFPRLAEEGRLAGYAFETFWQDITPAKFQKQEFKNHTPK